MLALGGWGVYMPYHTTWAHENEATVPADDAMRMRRVEAAVELPAAVRALALAGVA
ncbi:hypothetical protein D9M69_733450 [compost metagenome]